MENTTKIAFSAVSHIGAACTVNDDRIYANGKFLHQSKADYIQISLEVNDVTCLFALSDGMEDSDSGISLINDLKKFHQKAQSSTKDISVKLDDMVQCVEQSSNLLHSISLGVNDFRERKTAFSGILIDEGRIAAVNLGNCRVFKLDGVTFKPLVNDIKKADRLFKMGIISNEQSDMLTGQQKNHLEEGISTVRKSNIETIRNGIVYLICGRGLLNALNEDTIYSIISSGNRPEESALMLVEEAMKCESEDNITAIVVKVEETGEIGDQLPVLGKTETGFRPNGQKRYTASENLLSRKERLGVPRKNTVDFGKIISMTVLIVLSAVVILGGFKLWLELRSPEVRGVSSQEGTLNTADSSAGLSDSITDENSRSGDDDTIMDETTATDAEETALTGSDASPAESEGQDNEDADTQDAVDTDKAEIDTETAAENNDTEKVGTEGTTYVVKAGDMLVKISQKFYGTEGKYTLIMQANGIKDPNKIEAGMILKIPPLK